MSTLVNLTPHPIDILDGSSGEPITSIPQSGSVARVGTERAIIGEVEGIDIYKTTFGEVQDLPEPIEGTYYIVSALVMSALPDRADLLSPGELVRDEDGRVIGCRGLTR